MGAVYFYHLTQAPLEATLPVLLERSMAAGWQVEVRGTDGGFLDWLDTQLWLKPEEGFLPHARAGGAEDDRQPILLTLEPVGGRACVMSIQGADLSAEEVQAAERACILFDGHDAAAVAHARTQWKLLTGAGCAAQYWSQESGRWEKKAEA